MKFISLFAGIGGFDLALTRLGHEGVYANDIDKYCKITYDQHFTPKLDLRDIRTVKPDELPEFDLLCGGFPCQSFSIAGKRGGFEDTRGTLFFEIARIARDRRPAYLFLENVKGLLSHDEGNTFATIITTLDELGYDCQWQVCNSKDFGVPQNRERVFVIGHLRGQRRPEVFPLRGNEQKDLRTIGQDISSCLDANYYKEFSPNGQQSKSRQSIIVPTIRATEYKHGDNQTMIVQLNKPKHSNDRVYGTEGISPTLNTMQGGNRQPFIQNPKMRNYKKDYQNSVAVTATSYKEPPVVNGIRRLTPLECERLQSYPDNWTKVQGVSDTQRYKMIGNSVTVNVVYEIAKRAFSQ